MQAVVTRAAATEAEAIARNSVTQAKIGIRARVWGDQSRRFKRTVIYRDRVNRERQQRSLRKAQDVATVVSHPQAYFFTYGACGEYLLSTLIRCADPGGIPTLGVTRMSAALISRP